MASVTASQLRSFNSLQRPEWDAFGRRNHYHFAVKALPGVPGEAVFFANPYNKHHEIIVPLLLEAFVNRFDEPGLIPQMGSNIEPFAPFTWSTTDESLAQAVSRRCQEIGIRRDLCDVGITTAEELRSAKACWTKWSMALVEEMAMFDLPDDGVENVEMSCGNCGFTPSMDKPLHPCSQCLQVSYCSRECQTTNAEAHLRECAPEID
ncbi:Zinc fingerMYND-type [Penicillium desertorum]|uniref:Zinc fingerMYND-type n=1 Tax=Penicillium desertorum TaxID=1303715 RepID=A0A9X0BMR9_9EURO|nr:Zinc fingerMYND-type [Penicillium desertorum]